MTILRYLFPEATFKTPDPSLACEARRHLDSLTKPIGSLGKLEEIAVKLYSIFKGETPLSVDPGIFYIVAADHGAAKQNISPYPQEVTRQMVANFLAEGAAINCLTRTYDLSLRIIDAGCAGGAGNHTPPAPGPPARASKTILPHCVPTQNGHLKFPGL